MHEAHTIGGRGEEGGAIAGDVVEAGIAICLLPGDAAVIADGEYPVAAAGISDAHQERSIGHRDHLGLIATVVGRLRDLPGLAQVVAEDEAIVKGASLRVPHGSDVHDPSVAGCGAVTGGDEGGGVLLPIGVGAVGPVDLGLHRPRFAPGATIIGTLHDVLRHRLIRRGAPEPLSADKGDDHPLSVAGLDDADVPVAGSPTLPPKDDLGVGPRLAIVLAPAEDQVDILRDVDLIVLPPVRKGEERPLGGLDEGGDAEVARASVPRDEEGRIGAPALTGGRVAHLLDGVAPTIDRDGEDLSAELIGGVEGVLRHVGGEVEDSLVGGEAGALLPTQRDGIVGDPALVVVEITHHKAVAGEHLAPLYEAGGAGVEAVGDVDAAALGEDDGGEGPPRLSAHIAVPGADDGDGVGLGIGEGAEEKEDEGVEGLSYHNCSACCERGSEGVTYGKVEGEW